MLPQDKEAWRDSEAWWDALQDAALTRLRADVSRDLGPGLGGTRHLFQILARPAFDPVECWNVCVRLSRIEGKRYFVQHLTWRSDLDWEKTQQPDPLQQGGTVEPTFEDALIGVDGTFVEATLDRIKALHIPAFPENEVSGLDGGSYELAVGAAGVRVRYRWWCEPPTEWRELHEVVLAVIAYVASRSDRTDAVDDGDTAAM